MKQVIVDADTVKTGKEIPMAPLPKDPRPGTVTVEVPNPNASDPA